MALRYLEEMFSIRLVQEELRERTMIKVIVKIILIMKLRGNYEEKKKNN